MVHVGKKTWAVVAVGAAAVAGTGIVSLTATAAQPAPAAPAAQSAPVRLIVGYKSQAEQAGSDNAVKAHLAAKAQSLTLQRRLGTGAVLVDVGGADSKALIAALKADPNVAFVEPELRATTMAAPNDPDYSKQWHYFEEKAGMNVPGAWSSSTGAGVTVAVIDTGYAKHSDLEANTVAGYDFVSNSSAARDNDGRDPNPADQGDWSAAGECSSTSPAANSSWHGTHVAGTIAAATNNAKGVAGVAYDAKIQHVRVLAKCGGSFADIDDGIVWASGGTVNGVPANKTPAKVLNLSLGGQATCPTNTQNAINGAVQRGSVVVVAAGNSGKDAAGFTPASCKNVIVVAATDRDGNRAQFRSDNSASSNYGTIVDIAAPGGETWTASDRSNGILSTLNSGTTTPSSESYAFYQGTSMATPHVAGLAALMLGKKSDLTPAQVEAAIKQNARPLPGTCTGGCGAGIADAAKTVGSLGDTVGGPAVTNPGNQTGKVGVAASLQVKATDPAGKTLTYSASGLPAGLSINSTSGLISGTPTAAGTSNVTVTATNTDSKSGTTTFTWTVEGDGTGGTVTVTRPQDQWGFKGWAIQPLQMQGSSTAGGTLTFSATGLPPGLTISASGRITGTPTTSGTYTVTVTAKDSGGGTGTTTFGWRVY
ncbi:serine protease [Actinokineospora alba]|uniref:Serine protease n=1 Tax=Actinokineospora alba TaxID=504798 RepID=A0A1H0UD11_9PSEU|nr:serine protease [Actinokineospora alba]SDH56188.1 serine protease [Actinokineospora alba]SDP64021.1 serine protease [Actinokineospora alba]